MPITSHVVSGGVVCPRFGGQLLQQRAPGLAESLHHIVRAKKQQPFSGDQLHDSVSGVPFLSKQSRTQGCVPGALHGVEETHLKTMSSTACLMTTAKAQPSDGLNTNGEPSYESLWRQKADGFLVLLCGQEPLSLSLSWFCLSCLDLHLYSGRQPLPEVCSWSFLEPVGLDATGGNLQITRNFPFDMASPCGSEVVLG